VVYTLKKALEVGPWRFWKKMRSANACKTCALGMGGQKGGMVNEAGHFPEVCKKSMQAQAADMTGAIDPNFFDKTPLKDLLELTPKQAENLGRLTHPLVLEPGATHFKPVKWEDALEYIARELKETEPNESAFYSSGRASNEAAFLLQSFSRIYGTNNVMNCSFYCHQASGVALKSVFGTGTATINLEDISKCDLVFLIGANPASNHPRLMTQLANLRARGGKVIVVNPVHEVGLKVFRIPSQVKSMLFGSEIASLYVYPQAGGDIAFITGVLKSLIEKEKVDQEFLKVNTEGFEAVLNHAKDTSWEKILKESGVSRQDIELTADYLAQSKRAIFAWAMGLTHHAFGTDNVLALSNLALATGNVGKEGAGMLPIRGHSNVQGIGSMGVSPDLQKPVSEAMEKLYQIPMPGKTGYDTHKMTEAAGEGRIKCLVCLGGNLWGSSPDSQWAQEAMSKIKTTVYLSTKLNPGHFFGRGQTTFILPVLARDEEPQKSTQESMFNYVRLSDGGKANVEGTMLSEAQIICQLANKVLGDKPLDWMKLTETTQVRKLISQVIPGWQAIKEIEKDGEFTIKGRLFHTPKFNTLSGKAIMSVTPLPQFTKETGFHEDSLRLITLRSEGQFNSIVYEDYDIYRGMPHRYSLLIAREDLNRLGFADGERVTVTGEAGSLDNIELVEGKIRAGSVAMFYPEANILIKARIDSRSKTPSFKSAPVTLKKMAKPS
jgi:molybdopterin-dependent oxidoreductase alpha subunit